LCWVALLAKTYIIFYVPCDVLLRRVLRESGEDAVGSRLCVGVRARVRAKVRFGLGLGLGLGLG
jgi:hypothetical protein